MKARLFSDRLQHFNGWTTMVRTVTTAMAIGRTATANRERTIQGRALAPVKV
ncbi:hypothetical protein J5X98_09040 [Leptothermofonsia sichuanensis E412]|uniref:hypothetical protein n=1 Tax=Leptothermofonsia sichuanensis TaxID=2917832 RepID=UPI001CA71CBF|nr:hypothetical protein [Leptothermofonsia sichuanensis]QZZ22492.1 hypothetical protein J5X98_09040 [Leptothermofonsia sichuanensis E412]